MIQLKNNAQSTLSTTLLTAATSLTVVSGDGAKFPAVSVTGDHYYLALADNAGNVEYVKVTARTNDVFTITRAQEGSTARSWNVGTRVQLRMTAQTWEDMAGEIWTRLSDDGHTPLTPTTASTSSFTVTGDRTDVFVSYRSYRLHKSDGTSQIGYVSTSAYSSDTGLTTVNQFSETGYTPTDISGTYVSVDYGLPLETTPYASNATPNAHLSDASAHASLFATKQDTMTAGTGLSFSGTQINLSMATTSALGGVKPDGTIITIDSSTGTITVPTATASAYGVVKVDATPTDGSTNTVQSNGVYDALALKADADEYLPLTGGTMTGGITWNGTALNSTVSGRLDWNGAAVNLIGSVMWFASSTTPAGFLKCDGSSYSRTTYAALFAVIGTTYGSSSSTTFKVPDLMDKTVWGSSTVGTVKAAGLPNITGQFPANENSTDEISQVSGAFYKIAGTGVGTYHGDDDNGMIYFNASRSSSIYGNSTTVQPPALTLLPCIRYK